MVHPGQLFKPCERDFMKASHRSSPLLSLAVRQQISMKLCRIALPKCSRLQFLATYMAVARPNCKPLLFKQKKRIKESSALTAFQTVDLDAKSVQDVQALCRYRDKIHDILKLIFMESYGEADH